MRDVQCYCWKDGKSGKAWGVAEGPSPLLEYSCTDVKKQFHQALLRWFLQMSALSLKSGLHKQFLAFLCLMPQIRNFSPCPASRIQVACSSDITLGISKVSKRLQISLQGGVNGWRIACNCPPKVLCTCNRAHKVVGGMETWQFLQSSCVYMCV